jgi:hypothetical protein
MVHVGSVETFGQQGTDIESATFVRAMQINGQTGMVQALDKYGIGARSYAVVNLTPMPPATKMWRLAWR